MVCEESALAGSWSPSKATPMKAGSSSIAPDGLRGCCVTAAATKIALDVSRRKKTDCGAFPVYEVNRRIYLFFLYKPMTLWAEATQPRLKLALGIKTQTCGSWASRQRAEADCTRETDSSTRRSSARGGLVLSTCRNLIRRPYSALVWTVRTQFFPSIENGLSKSPPTNKKNRE